MEAQELIRRRNDLREKWAQAQADAQALGPDARMPEDLMQQYDKLAWDSRAWMKEQAKSMGIKPPYDWQIGIGALSIASDKIRKFCPDVAEQILNLASQIY